MVVQGPTQLEYFAYREDQHTALALYKVQFTLDLAHPTLSCVYKTVLYCQYLVCLFYLFV